VHDLKESAGLSAAVYTQTTDVERELNGMLTYDREVLKVDAEKVRAANEGTLPRIVTRMIVPTSQEQPQNWQYTFDAPAAGWMSRSFDDSSWKTGGGGFGTEGTPGAIVHTTWNTSDIWIRRKFDLPADVKTDDLLLVVHHDEDVEIYINGLQAAKRRRHTTDYEELSIAPPAKEAMKPGRNVIAIHCHQTVGGQYIDAGLIRLVEKR
jgi:hypothetical protein